MVPGINSSFFLHHLIQRAMEPSSIILNPFLRCKEGGLLNEFINCLSHGDPEDDKRYVFGYLYLVVQRHTQYIYGRHGLVLFGQVFGLVSVGYYLYGVMVYSCIQFCLVIGVIVVKNEKNKVDNNKD